MNPLDPQMVLRAQGGDAAARERIVTALQPALRGFFVNRIGAGPDVDDLLQNTLIRIHRGLNALLQPDRLKAFAMKAALYELQDHYRGRYSSRESLFDPDLPTPGSVDPDDVPLRLDLDRALAGLSEHARRILELRELGYPYTDIADSLGTTEAAVKMQVKRAFERLRATLTGVAVLLIALLGL
jgi:RNA polymerase sigma-70 factor (ECF subfamily)